MYNTKIIIGAAGLIKSIQLDHDQEDPHNITLTFNEGDTNRTFVHHIDLHAAKSLAKSILDLYEPCILGE